MDRLLTQSALDERYQLLVARSEALQEEWRAASRILDARIAHANSCIAAADAFLAKQAAVERRKITCLARAKPLTAR